MARECDRSERNGARNAGTDVSQKALKDGFHAGAECYCVRGRCEA